MALTNAEKQRRWRDKRNALAKLATKYQQQAARLKARIRALEARLAELEAKHGKRKQRD
jgi:hypothetical protein